MASKAKSDADALAKATKALSAHKTDIAVFWFKKWSEGNATHQEALRAGAQRAFAVNEWYAAATYLQPLIEGQPKLEDLSALAQLRERLGELDQALALYRKILGLNPGLTLARAKVSLICARLGNAAEALAVFDEMDGAGALDPAYVVNLADALSTTAPDAVPALVEKAHGLLSNAAAIFSPAWPTFLRLWEWQERRARGLSIANALSVDETKFIFTADRVQELYRAMAPCGATDRTSSWTLATLAFAAGDYDAATAAYQGLRAFGGENLWTTVELRTVELESLEGWDLAAFLADLPPVKSLRPQSADCAHEFLLPCDGPYFHDFGLPLLRSIAAKAAGTCVHLHLFAKDEGDAGKAQAAAESVAGINLRITAEYRDTGRYFTGGSDLREYYHAARFLRFAQFLESSKGALWLMDVDALLNGKIETAFEALGDAALGLRIRPGRTEPWNVFSACLVAARPTPATKAYFGLAGAYLARLMQAGRLYWGADQLALFAAFLVLNKRAAFPTCVFWPDEIADILFSSDGVFWFTGGLQKFKYIDNKDAPTSPFEALRRKYV